MVFTGSLGGLMALADGRADLAGCHLWDKETDTYNAPFVRRLLPGQNLGIDFSPVVVLLSIFFLRYFLVQTIIQLAGYL